MKKILKDDLLLCKLKAEVFENSIDKMDLSKFPSAALSSINDATERQYEIFKRIRKE